MAKFRKIKQQKTFTHREQYENALTLSKLKSRPKKISYVEIDIGDGKTTNVYFSPIAAADVVRFKDPALDGLQAVNLMIDLIAEKVVDPHTGEPLQGREEWAKEDIEFLSEIIGAVTGLQLAVEGEEVPEGEAVEIDIDIEALRNDPNPLDETVGSDSLTISTVSSESQDHPVDGEEETSKNG